MREVRLGELCTLRAGSAFPQDEQGAVVGDYPFVKVSDMALPGNAKALTRANNWISSEQSLRLRTTLASPGAILFAKIGVGLRAERFRVATQMTAFDNNMMSATAKPGACDSGFLYYLLQTLNISTHAVGSALPYLKQGDLEAIPCAVPELHEQQEIAEVLGALDDKIAANTKLAEITDDLVRAEYIALSEDVSETRTIASIATHPRDLVDPSQTNGNQIYVGLEHVPRRRMWLSDSGLSSDVTSTKASFAKGDVLFGKLRPYFHKVVSAPADGISSTDILVLRAKHASMAGFLLAAAASDATVERCTAASEGTRMPRTSWKDLGAVEVPWPGESAARSFAARVSALRDRVDSGTAENRTLAATRDALLPQLMSGRIRVRDAERVVEGVV